MYQDKEEAREALEMKYMEEELSKKRVGCYRLGRVQYVRSYLKRPDLSLIEKRK